MRRLYALGVIVVLAALAGGCRKRAPAPAPAASKNTGAAKLIVNCPDRAELVRAVGAPAGSTVEVDCLVFPDSMFWLAGALVRGPQPGDVRLQLISGSPYVRWLIYDVVPAPTQALQQLVTSSQEVQVKLRTGRRERRLVRVGVIGKRKKDAPDSTETLVLLRLGAHAPPEVVWIGRGDEVQSAPGGCVINHSVDFELLFGTRVEMFTSERSRGAAGCPAGTDMQESVTARPVRLQPGRPLPGKDGGAHD